MSFSHPHVGRVLGWVWNLEELLSLEKKLPCRRNTSFIFWAGRSGDEKKQRIWSEDGRRRQGRAAWAWQLRPMWACQASALVTSAPLPDDEFSSIFYQFFGHCRRRRFHLTTMTTTMTTTTLFSVRRQLKPARAFLLYVRCPFMMLGQTYERHKIVTPLLNL